MVSQAPALADYGIHNEASDLRLHVCFVVRRLYVYPTQSGVKAIRRGSYRKRPAYQQGLKTAEGYLVPPEDIPGLFEVCPRADIWQLGECHEFMNTSEKGKAAVVIAMEAMRRGNVPIPLMAEEVSEFNAQVEGVDVIVRGNARIQVKCDYKGGVKSLGGTGNLFLQVAESNPFKRY